MSNNYCVCRTKKQSILSRQTRQKKRQIDYICLADASAVMNFIYLEDYEKHPDARVNPALLWEYDLAEFDFVRMRNLVVQRVIERGWPGDWHAILNLYGEEGVRAAIMAIPYMNAKDMNFVSIAFDIPISKMKCYKKKPSTPQQWNS